jgi:putative transposase
MYDWRRLTPDQRAAVLAERRQRSRPWHGPPHYDSAAQIYLITAACFEHQPIIGVGPARMAAFEADLLAEAVGHCPTVYAWAVLPNHYHLLVHAPDIKGLLQALGLLHGRTSYFWNGEDGRRGRQTWHRAAETVMKSDRHFWATLNYVLNNPVRHGYAARWQDWPYSSAEQYLADVGQEVARRRWLEYPLEDYGNSWDPADK